LFARRLGSALLAIDGRTAVAGKIARGVHQRQMAQRLGKIAEEPFIRRIVAFG
jgi:hypothetical protein